MIVVKSISFTEEYSEELNHFLSQPNKSRYICDLIRKDIAGGYNGINREEIIQLIDERIKNLPTVSNTEGDTESIRDNLIGLFGEVQ